MSDIPIGSPPAPPGRHAAPQGWYPDPVDPAHERWWDGWNWSRNTRPAESPHPPPQPGTWPAQDFSPGQQQQPGQQPPGQQPPVQHAPGHLLPGRSLPGQLPPGQAGHLSPAQATGPRTADGVPLAGWGWRLLAGFVDLIIVTIVGSILSIPIMLKALPVFTDYINQTVAASQRGAPMPPLLDPNAILSRTDQILVSLISVVVAIAYFALFWRFKAATPGQLMCSLRVVPFGSGRNTEALSWGQVIIRTLIWAVPLTASSYLLLFAILNALFPLWNANRQAVHDVAAKTQVAKIK